MEQLPVQQRLIIQMRDIEQYEFEEIAKILEMNESAIQVALSRARKTIRII
jgi:RNA polymerase sigma-70 factor (ECF subfamily)